MRWLALALALVPACNLRFNSQPCGTADNQWICAEGLACADPPTYCGTPPPPDQCAQLADFTTCSLPAADNAVCVDQVCTACTNDLAGCPTGGMWKPMTSPSTQPLRALWVRSATDVYTVGDAGTVLHYDGHKWTSVDFPAVTPLVAIWGSETGDLIVLANDPPAIYRLSSGTWSTDTQATGVVLYAGLWGSSETDVWAVGLAASGGLTEHFDGVSWTAMSAGTINVLEAVWGSAADDVWAVGASSTIMHYQGSGWTTSASTVGAPKLNAIDGSSATIAYAVGDHAATPTVFSLQMTWQPADPALPPIDALAVWAPTATDTFLAGTSGLIAHGPASWTTMTNLATGAVRALKGSDPTNVWAVGDAGEILHYTAR